LTVNLCLIKGHWGGYWGQKWRK